MLDSVLVAITVEDTICLLLTRNRMMKTGVG